MINLYKKEQKQAQKEFHACTAAGQYLYLPVLNEFLPSERLNQGIDLGYLQIPLEFVVGTRTSGRTRAFSNSFSVYQRNPYSLSGSLPRDRF